MTAARILIVDDDPALLEALPEALRLRIRDLEIDTSDSAPAALERIGDTDFDALVVDIKMPGMDGLDLLSEIKQRSPETPTILITGHGDHELAVEALRGGAYDYVTKPIDRDYFVTSLSRAIECHRLSREVATKRLELLHHAEELEACVQDRTVELRDALHREQAARRELDEANHRLAALSRERETFISMIAHDLAAPLTTIRGYAELMGRPDPPTEQLERARSIIISETGRLARLANDLVDSAQLVGGHFQIALGSCDLSEIVREQVEIARARTDRRTIRLDAPPSLPLACDRDRLAQLISNLLSNAVKYAPDGDIDVRLDRDDDRAQLSVADHGPGIPAEQAELVFEPGRRLPDDQATRPDGAGFGLHIAKGIVEAHGGRIWVEQTPGGGATFRVALPLAPGIGAAQAAAPLATALQAEH